jgi:hypothetical protein
MIHGQGEEYEMPANNMTLWKKKQKKTHNANLKCLLYGLISVDLMKCTL